MVWSGLLLVCCAWPTYLSVFCSCTDPGGAGQAGTDSNESACTARAWCSNGTQCDTSPSWLVKKMELYWEWALAERAIKGINPWHWQDVPVSRGAVHHSTA